MERIKVQFEGDGVGAGEPTWGQREIYGVGGEQGRHVTMGGAVPLPPGVSPDAFAEGMSYLISRHPALRTRFRRSPTDRVVQQVVAEGGEVWLDVVDADGADPAQKAQDIAGEFDTNRFDCTEDFPVRLAVVRVRGELTHAIAVYNHLAIDAYGMDAMMADLFARDPRTGLGPSLADASVPLDQALWQSSAAGRRHNDRALRYWGRLLREIPARGLAGDQATAAPTRETYGKIILDSPAADLAGRLISARTRLDTGHILLAAHAVAVARVTGLNPVPLRVVVSNRFRPGLADSVSTLSQSGLCAVDTADAGFDEVCGRVWRASLDMYKNSYFDPDGRQELYDAIGAERGEKIMLDCCYNDRRRGRTEPLPASVGETAPAPADPAEQGAPPDPADLPGAVDRGHLQWEPWHAATAPVGETLYVHVDAAPESVVFTVCGDIGFLSAPVLEECARTIEAVLVEAALDPAAPTGVRSGAGSRIRVGLR